MYKRLDDKYIKPCLLRENHVRDPKIIETYENLTERDALEFMKRNPTQFVESMSEIKGNGNQIAPNKMNDENFDEGDVVEGDQENNNYHQSQRDLDDSNIHHMLSENLFMPRNRVSNLYVHTAVSPCLVRLFEYQSAVLISVNFLFKSHYSSPTVLHNIQVYLNF